MSARYVANLRLPAQHLRLKVRPARDGIRLDIGTQHVFLNKGMAIGLANAVADCLEAPKETTTDE